MIGSRRYDHVFRFDEPGRRLDDQTRRSHLPAKAGGGYSAAHRRTNDGRILLQEAYDVVAGRERMGVVGLKGESREADVPVGALKHQGIPTLAVPSLCDAPPFKNEMFAPELAEVIAHGQAGLAPANDDGFNLLLDHGGGSHGADV